MISAVESTLANGRSAMKLESGKTVDVVSDDTCIIDESEVIRWLVESLGTISNEQIPSLLQEHDILILPSIYDGWGAVVNEALMQGKYVICSNQCGAQALLRNHMNGTTFKTRNYKELANQMLYCIDHISDIREQEVFRIKWAKENISGKAIAKYMIDCIQILLPNNH